MINMLKYNYNLIVYGYDSDLNFNYEFNGKYETVNLALKCLKHLKDNDLKISETAYIEISYDDPENHELIFSGRIII